MTEKEIEDYKKSLESLSLEELQKLEAEIVETAEALDKEAAEKTFTLKDADGGELKFASRNSLGKAIAGFITRVEVSWQQALVMKVIVDFWKSKSNEIKFPVLDSTLRLLGQAKYSGAADIELIAETNAVLENIRDEYTEFSSKLFDTAEKHQAILSAMEMLKPVEA